MHLPAGADMAPIGWSNMTASTMCLGTCCARDSFALSEHTQIGAALRQVCGFALLGVAVQSLDPDLRPR